MVKKLLMLWMSVMMDILTVLMLVPSRFSFDESQLTGVEVHDASTILAELNGREQRAQMGAQLCGYGRPVKKRITVMRRREMLIQRRPKVPAGVVRLMQDGECYILSRLS